jgi:hypothetical protein
MCPNSRCHLDIRNMTINKITILKKTSKHPRELGEEASFWAELTKMAIMEKLSS